MVKFITKSKSNQKKDRKQSFSTLKPYKSHKTADQDSFIDVEFAGEYSERIDYLELATQLKNASRKKRKKNLKSEERVLPRSFYRTVGNTILVAIAGFVMYASTRAIDMTIVDKMSMRHLKQNREVEDFSPKGAKNSTNDNLELVDEQLSLTTKNTSEEIVPNEESKLSDNGEGKVDVRDPVESYSSDLKVLPGNDKGSFVSSDPSGLHPSDQETLLQLDREPRHATSQQDPSISQQLGFPLYQPNPLLPLQPLPQIDMKSLPLQNMETSSLPQTNPFNMQTPQVPLLQPLMLPQLPVLDNTDLSKLPPLNNPMLQYNLGNTQLPQTSFQPIKMTSGQDTLSSTQFTPQPFQSLMSPSTSTTVETANRLESLTTEEIEPTRLPNKGGLSAEKQDSSTSKPKLVASSTTKSSFAGTSVEASKDESPSTTTESEISAAVTPSEDKQSKKASESVASSSATPAEEKTSPSESDSSTTEVDGKVSSTNTESSTSTDSKTNPTETKGDETTSSNQAEPSTGVAAETQDKETTAMTSEATSNVSATANPAETQDEEKKSSSTSTTDEAKPSTNQGKKEQPSTQPESASTKPESSSTNTAEATNQSGTQGEENPESSTNMTDETNPPEVKTESEAAANEQEEELYDPSEPIVLDPPVKVDTIRRLQVVTA